jgi:tRNA A37 threonylcarbamoyladenosine synthetase subunit TsaC/SUA5/YrdC
MEDFRDNTVDSKLVALMKRFFPTPVTRVMDRQVSGSR